MGNKGAFITLTRDLKPKYTTYDAVVSSVATQHTCTYTYYVTFGSTFLDKVC